ncbi:MAG: hypothetical protein EOP54_03205 [Sphingobacteriales bacterium]|nr:MAG: hypothetical protein EOP54_03205 [Sphingobacteriales bacterium]
MRKALILCLLLCSRLLAFAVPADILNLWTEANRAYQDKQYEHAIDNYKSILQAKFSDAQVYYNLGNAYYKNGQKGPALVNYIRALKANPALKEARQNINFIQAQPGFAGIPSPSFSGNALLNMFSPNTWAWLAVLLLLPVCILILLKLRGRLRYANRWLALSTILAVLVFALSIFAHQKNSFKDTAVVTVENGFLYDNQKKTNVKLNLAEGTIVTIISTAHSSLVEVTLGNGIKGWIDGAELEKI